MTFASFYSGQVLQLGSHQVTEEEVLAYARQFDPQPFHVDRDAAAATHWKGLIASGFHTCAIAMRLLCDGALRGSESVGSPGLEYVKWPNAVRPGDTLTLKVHVLDTRVSSSARHGVVRWQWLLLNDQNAVVLDLVATSLFAITAAV